MNSLQRDIIINSVNPVDRESANVVIYEGQRQRTVHMVPMALLESFKEGQILTMSELGAMVAASEAPKVIVSAWEPIR